MSRETASSNPYLLETAKLEWQQETIPVASQFGDIYYAGAEGLAETRFVFLEQNLLAERWRALVPKDNGTRPFVIGETGFGTGLNFLASWHLWRQLAPPQQRLYFISVEKHPLQRRDLQRALAQWPELETLAGQLVDNYPALVPGQHCLHFEAGRVTLLLLFGDAIECLQQLCASHRPDLPLGAGWQVDAWFLDGFAPAKNPSLWNDTLYQTLARLSGEGTSLATFTAVGEVRRGLQRAGFDMQKVQGFGRKREMLRGTMGQAPPLAAAAPAGVRAPWYLPQQSTHQPVREVAVIGGGLAGTHTARALARRGIRVSLIESAPALATGASGNPLGMLYTKLSPRAGTLNQFTLASYLYALRHYQAMPGLGATNRASCGVLQLAIGEKDRGLLAQLQHCFGHLPGLVQCVSPEQASQLAGIALQHPGWFFPAAGWLAPAAVCRQLADHPLVEILLNRRVCQLQPLSDQRWLLLDAQQQPIASADAVVIASSHEARQLAPCAWLPLKVIRGQVSQAPADANSAALKTVLCHEGYLTPAVAGQHHFGATFVLNDCATELREAEHCRNLDSQRAAVPQLFPGLNGDQLQGRAGLRCASPDYLPMVGPAPNYPRFLDDYSALRKNAHSPIDTPGNYHPGLYLNLAHGSRGLTSTPLSAELLASSLLGEPPPVGLELQQALNPARFIIRDLIRSRI